MTKKPPIIHLKNISYAYSDGRRVLSGLNLSIHPGDRIGLMGPNGCGKTTLFHIIMGLLTPMEGTVELFGDPVRSEKDFQRVRRRVGLMFQDADDQLFSPTVLEDVAFGPLNMGKTTDEAQTIARETLALIGMDGFESRITHKLSGGEKRMIALGTVLAMNPDVLLLDEPTAGLDNDTQIRLQEVLMGLNLPYLAISHEFDFLTETTNALYIMHDGKIITDEAMQVHQHYHAHVHGAHPHDHQE